MAEQIYKENQKGVSESLQQAIDVEQATSSCFRYISEMVKNGRIRNRFASFAEESEKNKEMLLQRLEALGYTDFVLEDKCRFCKLTPESFSLFGALNLGLEITDISSRIYNDLVSAYKASDDEVLFKRLLNEKKQLRSFLKKEKNFVEVKSQPDFIMNFCIPHIAGKLAK